MIKGMVLHGLKEGVDPDEFWKYYLEVLAPNFAAQYKESGGLQRYVINRITSWNLGEKSLVGIAEIQFATTEDHANRHSTPESIRDANWFNSMINPDIRVWVEEHVIVGDTGLVK